jgi:hypothetical protein
VTIADRSRQLEGTRIWRLRKQHQQVDALLREDAGGPAGVEIRFLYNGELTYARRWATRDDALSEANAKRAELEREGWTAHW